MRRINVSVESSPMGSRLDRCVELTSAPRHSAPRICAVRLQWPTDKGAAVDRLVVLGGSCRSVWRTSLPGLPHRDRPCTTPDMPRSCNPLAENDCIAEGHSSCRWRWDGWHSPSGCRRAARGHRAGTAPACSTGGHTADIRQSCLDQRFEKPFCIAKVLSSLRQWKD